jgi:LGFP repeat
MMAKVGVRANLWKLLYIALASLLAAAALNVSATNTAEAATRTFTGASLAGNGSGYVLTSDGGQTYAFGMAYHGNPAGFTGRIVAVSATANGGGYAEISSTGQVYAYGNMVYRGNPSGFSGTITDIAVTANGQGYAAISSTGQVYAYGNVVYHGNPSGFSGSIVRIAVTADGLGYVAVSSTGQLYAYGTAHAWPNPIGFTGDITGLSLTGNGAGLVVMSSSGQSYAYGSAHPWANPTGFTGRMVGLGITQDGQGLVAMSSSGQVYAYGTLYRGNGDPGTPDNVIDAKYQSLGGSTSFLGSPVSPVFTVKNGGLGRHYQGGSIYWSSQTGAHEVHGAIRDLWATTGWENGHLGMPISDETTGYNGQVRVSHFVGGDIYWTAATGASESLPATVADAVHTQSPFATPAPPGSLEYSYSIPLDTTGYLHIPANPDLAFKELEKCFNCTFPVEGAPKQFPAEGQYMPLNACHFIPVVNHLCQAPLTVYSNGRTFMRFTTLPGHFDGPGATVTFTFYDGGLDNLWLNVTAYVINPVLPESVTRPGAHLMWEDFAANLDHNIWLDYCSHGC